MGRVPRTAGSVPTPNEEEEEEEEDRGSICSISSISTWISDGQSQTNTGYTLLL